MTSKLKVNILADGGDNAILTSDGSGSLTINNAALKMTPAFEAKLGADQTVSDNTFVKANINTEIFDSDSKYDTSTYRFTPGVAGKYFVYGTICGETDATELQYCVVAIYKNGSTYQENICNFMNNRGNQVNVVVNATIDFNTTDYVELYGKVYKHGGSTIRFTDALGGASTSFGAYRIIGA